MICKVHINYSIAMIKNASAGLQSATGKYFVVRDFANMSFQCFFQQPQFASPSEGHIISLPSYSWGTSTVLALHTIFAGYILTMSNFLQEHRNNITLMMSSSEEIHLTILLKPCKYSWRSSKKTDGHFPVHSTRSCHHSDISENYLVNWGLLHLWHFQEIAVDHLSTHNVKTSLSIF